MNTLNFLDANVWLALLWNRHMHAEKATSWFKQAGEEEFFFCRFVQLTVLRLLTTERVMGRDVKTMPAAWAIWDEVIVDPRIKFLSEPSALEHEFRKQSQLSSSSPKVWADAYLQAFAAVAGLKLVTFDRALRLRSSDVLVL